MPVPRQGLRNIRTAPSIKRSGTQASDRHVHQFRLAALELETTRLHREKQAAERRIEQIMERLAETRSKMDHHRQMLEHDPREGLSSTTPRPGTKPRLLRY